MAKKAVLVGCNYPGTKAELKGCVNDVKRMYSCLTDRFGFQEENITVMIDTDRRSKEPTGANIRRALTALVEGAEPGDVLFFHYSGHGVRLPAESGDEDDTGYDECIVPTDMNLITGVGPWSRTYKEDEIVIAQNLSTAGEVCTSGKDKEKKNSTQTPR